MHTNDHKHETPLADVIFAQIEIAAHGRSRHDVQIQLTQLNRIKNANDLHSLAPKSRFIPAEAFQHGRVQLHPSQETMSELRCRIAVVAHADFF